MDKLTFKNLSVPEGEFDVVLDTDAFNEIDDQFAISYLLSYSEKAHTKAIYAAPFQNHKAETAAMGMQKSYDEILKLLSLTQKEVSVFCGSGSFLSDEKTPIISAAAEDLAKRALDYTPENPLYVIAIGAITNIASALLLKPEISDKMVVVWLGGNARHHRDTYEFNMKQDIAAARIVMKRAKYFVQLPCEGVVSLFRISGAELEKFLIGKNPTAEYLARNTINEVKTYCDSEIWSRVIWDVTAVAWVLNRDNRFMKGNIVNTRLPDYKHQYEAEIDKPMLYISEIDRDALMRDMLERLISL